jgi:CubicO group peptidase (beta-lactamase class C family)
MPRAEENRFMKRIQSKFLIVAVTCWLSMPCVGAEDPLAGLEDAVSEARELWKAPGLAAAIVKDGETVFMEGFGKRQLGESAPVDEHTLFTLASTTKAFVAVALGMLVDEGRLAWDDPVINHLPAFRVSDSYATREITIRDLLSHRTGVEPVDWLWVRGFEPAAGIEHLQYAEQAAGLRSTWIYNNMMYVVAGEVVARVSGMTLPDFVRLRIFEPLGMTESVFTLDARLRDEENVAGAHTLHDGAPLAIEPYRSGSPLGAAGIHSSIADMSLWLRFLLNEGRVKETRLLKEKTFAELFKPQMIAGGSMYPAAEEAGPHFFSYGLGWFLQDYRGRLLAMHTGSLFGANALVALVPEEELGLVILINADPVEYRHAFMYDVVDRFLGTRETDWSRRLHAVYAKLEAEDRKEREEAEAERAGDSKPSVALSHYTGTYNDPLVGDAQVAKNGEDLQLLLPPDATFTLRHWSYDTFEATSPRIPDSRFRLTFSIGADGVATGYQTEDGRRFARVPSPNDILESD